MKFDKYLNVFFVLTISILSILYSTVFFKFFPNINFLSPNLILIIVIYISIFRNFLEGAVLVLFVSYLDSLHTPSFIGGAIIVNLIIFTILNYLSQHIYVRNLRTLLILVSSVVVGEKVFNFLLIHFFKFSSVSPLTLFSNALIELPIDLISALIIFHILRRVDLYTGFKKEKTDFFSGPIYLRKA